MEKTNTYKKSRFDLDQYLVDSKNRAYFVGLVTVVSVVAIIVGGVMPAYSAVINQNKENENRDIAQSLLTSKLEVLKKMIEEESVETEEISLLEKSFPDFAPQDDVIREVTAISQNLNVKLNSISFSKSSRDAPTFVELQLDQRIQSQEISLALDGKLETLQSFIQNLESSKRIYNIRNIVFQRKSLDDLTFAQDFEYKMTMKVEFFWWDNSINPI